MSSAPTLAAEAKTDAELFRELKEESYSKRLNEFKRVYQEVIRPILLDKAEDGSPLCVIAAPSTRMYCENMPPSAVRIVAVEEVIPWNKSMDYWCQFAKFVTETTGIEVNVFKPKDQKYTGDNPQLALFFDWGGKCENCADHDDDMDAESDAETIDE